MPFIQTDIQGVVVFEPRVFTDARGYFFETYNEQVFREAGIDAVFVQDTSVSLTLIARPGISISMMSPS